MISILKAPTCILKSNYLKCLQTVVIRILLTVTKAGSQYCRLPLKVTGEETQEATPSRTNGGKIQCCWMVSLYWIERSDLHLLLPLALMRCLKLLLTGSTGRKKLIGPITFHISKCSLLAPLQINVLNKYNRSRKHSTCCAWLDLILFGKIVPVYSLNWHKNWGRIWKVRI